MKVFWAWQSDHPRKISRDVIRTALEEAIDHLKQERGIVEAPEESRGDLHLDHDTKGLTGSPDVARSILEKIEASTVFVGDVTPVGKTPDVRGNEGIRPGRPLINSNVAIEYGFALRKLTDSAVLGVLNLHYGTPENLPFDIIHKRWPIRYQLHPEATNTEIDAARNNLRSQFLTALKGFLENPKPEEQAFEEIPARGGKELFFHPREYIGHSNQLGGKVAMSATSVLYMRLIPTKTLARPLSEKTLVSNAYPYGAMGSPELMIAIANEYGAMCFSARNGTRDVEALTQYFSNGEIWAINAEIMRHGQRSDDLWYLLDQAEDAFIKTLGRGLKYMKEVSNVEMPIKVTAGVVGLKGRRIVVSGAAIGVYGRMVTDQVHLTRVFHDDSFDAQDKFLFELFEKIFDQSGEVRPRNLNRFLNKSRG